jgi:hypothetical protein
MSSIPPFDPSDLRTTLERADEWVRTDDDTKPDSFAVIPKRTWSYYTAIIIALLLVIAVVSGTGAVVMTKGERLIQRYIERLYGVDDPS